MIRTYLLEIPGYREGGSIGELPILAIMHEDSQDSVRSQFSI